MECNVECYKHFLKEAEVFNVWMLISPLVENAAGSLVGSKSESLYTAGATLRHEMELRIIRESGYFFIS